MSFDYRRCTLHWKIIEYQWYYETHNIGGNNPMAIYIVEYSQILCTRFDIRRTRIYLANPIFYNLVYWWLDSMHCLKGKSLSRTFYKAIQFHNLCNNLSSLPTNIRYSFKTKHGLVNIVHRFTLLLNYKLHNH